MEEQANSAKHISPEADQFISKLMDSRGAIMLAFAQVEWFLAKLIFEASKFDQYRGIDLSFSEDAKKRAAVLKKVLNVDGPLSLYADKLKQAIDRVIEHERLRNMSAHGLTIRPDTFELSAKIQFRMFRMMKGADLQEEKLELTNKEYTDQSSDLTAAAREVVGIVRAIWKDLNFTDLEPKA